MLALVAVAALGCAAMRSGSWLWASVTFTMTLGFLGLAIVGAIYHRGERRAFWLGFATFGWIYLYMAFSTSTRIVENQLISKQAAAYLRNLVQPETNAGLSLDVGGSRLGVFSFTQIVHSLFIMAFALVGGVLASWVYRASEKCASRTRHRGDAG